MPISIIDNFDVNAPKNIDARLGPYDTTANALASIDEVTQRYLGLTVLVTGSGISTEYWFQDGVTDSDLVLKPIGSAVGFPYSGSDSLNNDPQQALITGSLYLSGSGHITASGDISASGNLFALASDGASISHVALYNTSSGQFFYTASNALSTQANTLQQVMDAGSTASVSTDIEIENGGGRLFFDGIDESISITSSGSAGTGAIRLNSYNATGTPVSASLGVVAGHIYFQGSNLGTPSAGNILVATNTQGRVKWTGSSAVGASTGSFLTTASADFSEITFTKGDASTFLVDSTPRRVIETVKNLETGTLLKGTPVYASGSTGNAIHVYAASSSRSDRMPAAYVLNNDLTSGQEGIGILTGFINGVDTSAFASGDVVYVGANGGYTNVKPTGSNLIQNLGKVVISDAVNGSGVISGAGRANDVPNITPGYFWLGNSDSVATPTATSSIQNVVSSSYATTASYALEAAVPTLQQVTDQGATTTNDITITGSLIVSSSNSTASLTLEGSGSTVFEVIGSEGTLFSIDDDLDGIIFTANDRSGLPVLQASASGEVYIGKSPQSLYTTAVISSTTAATTQSIYGLSTSSYGGAFVDYMVQSGSNARAGNMMAVWNGSNINFTETTTTDIGDTTDFNIIVHISQSQAQIASHATNAGYNIKTIIKAI